MIRRVVPRFFAKDSCEIVGSFCSSSMIRNNNLFVKGSLALVLWCFGIFYQSALQCCKMYTYPVSPQLIAGNISTKRLARITDFLNAASPCLNITCSIKDTEQKQGFLQVYIFIAVKSMNVIRAQKSGACIY